MQHDHRNTAPAKDFNRAVVEGTAEVGIDIADRSPKWVADLDQLNDSDYLVTMRCSIMRFDPAQYGVESHEWDLTNPDGQDMGTVREVRDEIEARLETPFDEVERLVEEERVNTNSSSGFITAIRDSPSL